MLLTLLLCCKTYGEWAAEGMQDDETGEGARRRKHWVLSGWLLSGRSLCVQAWRGGAQHGCEMSAAA